jgi:LysM repeat protein
MIFRYLILCIISVFITQTAVSQVTVVPSTTRTVIDGKPFYLHTVKQGETLYSISRAYNASQKEVELYNPGAGEGIKIGQHLMIPVGYKIHTVVRGETLFSISKSYNVNMNEILDINPDIDAKKPKLSISQQIKIPVANAEASSLSQPPPPNEIKPESQVPNPETKLKSNEATFTKFNREIRIAMLLPLHISDNFSASASDTALMRDAEGGLKYRNGKYFIQQRSTNTLEYLMGAMMAIDSLKKQGFTAKVYIHDTMRDTGKIAQILDNPEMKNADLIIGPFTTELVDKVANFACENRIHCVTPTAISAESLKNNPYLMQVTGGEINTVNTIVNYIATQKDIHITLISNTRESDKTIFNAYRNKLKSVFPDSVFNVVKMRLDSMQYPGRYLKKNLMNVVIIPSSDEIFIQSIIGGRDQLHASANNFQINVYGLISWTKFAQLDLGYLHTLEFRYATAYNIDYGRQEVKNFIRQFKKLYFTEPTMVIGLDRISPYPYQIAFLGYDVTFFFISALIHYGEDFGENISNFRMNMLQSDFHFERLDTLSGFRNTHLDIYKYDKDYSIVKETVNSE